jgi:hypothetical protein
LGDLHGDFEVLFYSLHNAGLINDTGDWTGGDSVVIQLGDMTDGVRGTSRVPYTGEKKVVNFLKNLHQQAVNHGGMVVTMLGNHDVNRLLSNYYEDGSVRWPNDPDYYVRGEYRTTHRRLPRYSQTHQRNLWPGQGPPPPMPNQKDFQYRMNPRLYQQDLHAYQVYQQQHPNDRHRSAGIDPSYGSRANSFLSPCDFSQNRSLKTVPPVNQYPVNEEQGFHRQLFASCASKLLLKAVWVSPTGDDTDIGILASHGEKNYDYLRDLRDIIAAQLTVIDTRYQLGFERLLDLQNNNDNLIVFINSLFAFFLRKYHRVDVTQDMPFSNLVFDFLNAIGSNTNENFLWCYITQRDRSPVGVDANHLVRTCRSAADSMDWFGLDPIKSTCLSAHSGPMSLINTYRIKMNEGNPPGDVATSGWCYGVGAIPPVHPSIHPNTVIMTDVTASKAFSDHRPDTVPPQIVELVLNPTSDGLVARNIAGTVGVDRLPLRHDSPELADKVANPQGLRLKELAGGRRRR